MSRRLLAFLLSELKTVRLICPRPQCGGVAELSVESLAVRFGATVRQPACPLCNHDFVGVDSSSKYQTNPLLRLSEAVLELQGVGKTVAPELQIEFVLPDLSE